MTSSDRDYQTIWSWYWWSSTMDLTSCKHSSLASSPVAVCRTDSLRVRMVTFLTFIEIQGPPSLFEFILKFCYCWWLLILLIAKFLFILSLCTIFKSVWQHNLMMSSEFSGMITCKSRKTEIDNIIDSQLSEYLAESLSENLWFMYYVKNYAVDKVQINALKYCFDLR